MSNKITSWGFQRSSEYCALIYGRGQRVQVDDVSCTVSSSCWFASCLTRSSVLKLLAVRQHLTWEKLCGGFQLAAVDKHSDSICHPLRSLLRWLLTAVDLIRGCFGSRVSLAKGQVQRREEPRGPSRRGQCVWVRPTHILQGSGLSSQPSPLCGELFVFPFALARPHEWAPCYSGASVCERFSRRWDTREVKKKEFIKGKVGRTVVVCKPPPWTYDVCFPTGLSRCVRCTTTMLKIDF